MRPPAIIARHTLAEFFHAHKSPARRRLVDAMYDSQSLGRMKDIQSTIFNIQQDATRCQVTFTWERTVDVPQWAVDRNLCEVGGIINQSVGLCFTGRDKLSVLMRVYRGHCYNQVERHPTTVAKATAALLDPEALLT